MNLDAGLAKSFALISSRETNLKVRADALKVLNHPSFLRAGESASQNDVSQPGSFGN